MKIFLFSFFFVWFQYCYSKNPSDYAHSIVSNFESENTLKCLKGNVYILQCQIKCMNSNNEIIYKECLNDIEKICKDKKTCSYYFDYIFKTKNHKLRNNNNNNIYIDNCIDSDKNEIKSTFTCVLNPLLEFDNNNHVIYNFLLNNKNNDKIVCKNSNIYINNATIHYTFSDIKFKDVTSYIKEKCNEKTNCVINPYSIQTDILNEKNDAYLLNSYISISFACVKINLESYLYGGDIDEFDQINDEENEDNKYLDHNDLDEKNEEIISLKNEINDILNDEKIDNIAEKLKIAKFTISKKINEEIKKKNDIFNNLANDIYQFIGNEYYFTSDIKDMIEDRYNELNKTSQSDLYYIYLLNVFDIEKIYGIYLSSYQERLQQILQTNMTNLDYVEKKIGSLRNIYMFLYKKSKKYNALDIFDEYYDYVLNYNDFAKDNEIISADIFIKSKPDIPQLNFEINNENKNVKYKDVTDLDELDNLNRINRIINIRNVLVKQLKILYNQRNNIFIKQAMLVKSYCYKNPLDITDFSSIFKNNYNKLKYDAYKEGNGHINVADKINPNFVVKYLNNLYKQHVNKNYILNSWDPKYNRMNKKIKIILILGYGQVIQIEKQINRHIGKYNALLEKATLYNVGNLFTQTTNILNDISGSLNDGLDPNIHDQEDVTVVESSESNKLAEPEEPIEKVEVDRVEKSDDANNATQQVTGTDEANYDTASGNSTNINIDNIDYGVDESIRIIKYSKAEEDEYNESGNNENENNENNENENNENENNENENNENENIELKNIEHENKSNASSASLSNIFFTFIIAALFIRPFL
ncbi:surface protein P113 [Plasmodium berghei]|uniref:Surface protein P113 n=1 Tax=Plasmodium berghei TaxID=5821 RepID=A0A1D3LVV7_PLABE|nr:surface protein P113 [Plasmodium berghei]